MQNQPTRQAVVVSQPSINTNEYVQRLALFNEDGSSLNPSPQTGANLTHAPLTTATVIGTAAKVIADPEPTANTLVAIKFTNGNSATSPTVAFNGGAARAVLLGGTAPAAGEITLAANGVAMFFFDGTNLHQLGVYS